MHRVLLAIAICLLCQPMQAQGTFDSQVRETVPLPPQEQLKKFHLPEGFTIQLFAAEPDIQKPMNMAFDARGRLWVSGSTEYPYAAEAGQGRDSIRILEDTDGDAAADLITTFVDGLNIPMGLYPYRHGVVAYSIPNIWFFQDDDGDGRADRRDVLYGSLGQPVDTHGMQNAFRRGFDGWLYICHGFRNDSTIEGTDGSRIELNSGNTYRVRLDGSRVEQFTWGQVNPFGSTLTPAGDFITADCHSKPLTLLIRGGYYPSFAKPHDGSGFVPAIMEHSHGSTAIAGAAYYADEAFPPEYQGSLFAGNVMTSRVHCDRILRRGSTLVAREAADFVTCDDPWFRPVDLQIGPDGALYIADFYNRIIGHYEVPLDHPGRDRVRGRIWRVSYAPHDASPSDRPRSLAAATVGELIEALASRSLARRMLATDQLSDRIGSDAIEPLRKAIAGDRAADSFATPTREGPLPEGENPHPGPLPEGEGVLRVHALWVLHRLDALGDEELAHAARDPRPIVRIHAMRLVAEISGWSDDHRKLAVAGLDDPEPLVRRAAADALAQHADFRGIPSLLAALQRVAEPDRHLHHAVRLALRDQMRHPGTIARLRQTPLSRTDRDALAEVALAVPSEEAAALLVDWLLDRAEDAVVPLEQLRHAVAYASADRAEQLVDVVRRRAGEQVDLQLELLLAMQDQLLRRGSPLPDVLRRWGSQLADQLLTALDEPPRKWINQSDQNPWGLEPRQTSDGFGQATFLSSLPGGEQQTAVLRSRTFEIPPRLQFELCGHRGFPPQPPSDGNYVQLVAETGEVLRKVYPPRNDRAVRIDWDLAQHAGERGYLEVVDGLDLPAYAWLAVARFSPAVVTLPEISPQVAVNRQVSAAAIAKAMKLEHLRERLRERLANPAADARVRLAAADALLAIEPQPIAAALLGPLADPALGRPLREPIAEAIAGADEARLVELTRQAMQTVPLRLQLQMADALAASRAGARLLVELVEQGTASGWLLQQPALAEKLAATGLPGAEQQIARLIEALPPLDMQTARLVQQRRAGYRAASPVVSRGEQLFAKHCASCHQVQGKGSVVGPQLDGIGNRGLERVLEDVLDPNRNIDAAFHTSILALADGRVLTGLFRRREGNAQIFADQEGKEFSISDADLDQQRKVQTSIMPGNLGATLPEADFYDLLAYLLSLRQQVQAE